MNLNDALKFNIRNESNALISDVSLKSAQSQLMSMAMAYTALKKIFLAFLYFQISIADI